MSTTQHGISLGIIRVNNEYFFEFTARGKLTHSDYQFIMPMVESTIPQMDTAMAKALVDIRNFDGWEPRALLDDLKFDIKHRKDFKKMAIVGSKRWEEWMTKLFGWFMSGETEYFEDRDSALAWLQK